MSDKLPPIPPRSQMLDDVKAIITGARQSDYGDPNENFRRIADIFQGATDRDFSNVEVVLFNIAQKLARLAESPCHADSWRDIAGYAALGYEITRVLAAEGKRGAISPRVIVDDTTKPEE